jgi:hypothetical protein
MDYLPMSLLKSSTDVMAPLIARLANMSFDSGVFPLSLKIGRVTPIVKKPGLTSWIWLITARSPI